MAVRGRFLRAEELFFTALALDLYYPEALHSYANLLGAVGRHTEALATRQRLVSMEPFVPVYQSGLSSLLWINGETGPLMRRLKFPSTA